jgi:hypothetical protein
MQLICDVNEFYTSTWGEVDGYDYTAARTWLSSVSEVPVERLLESVRSLPSYVGPIPKPLEMSEARLAVFTTPPQEQLDKRMITAESASAYGVVWDSKKKSWILPLRDSYSGKLMGWQEKGTEARTFFNRPTGLQKSKTLFGLQNLTEEYVIVVESPLDCLRFYSEGYTSVVAICGSSLSEEQVKLLRAADKIIAAFDSDAAGNKASKEMLAWGRKYGLNLFFFNYGDSGKKDPGDMTADELAWGIQNAKTSLLGEKAYVQGNTQAISG